MAAKSDTAIGPLLLIEDLRVDAEGIRKARTSVASIGSSTRNAYPKSCFASYSTRNVGRARNFLRVIFWVSTLAPAPPAGGGDTAE